jgi:glutamyl/glutaminyl-tRNA synthetase
MPTYNYVVVIDDADMKITHVIRGDDHISNTPKQVAVYEALGLPVPEFAHLSTILGPDRERLSKRHGATSVANFREMGILPEALMNYLALLGWAPSGGDKEIFTKEELIKEFDLKRVTPSPAIFDFQKLYWINRQYIKRRFGSQEDGTIDVQVYSDLVARYGTDEEKNVHQRIQKLAELLAKHPKVSAALHTLFPFIEKGWLDLKTLGEVDRLNWFLQLVALFAPYADRLDQVADQAAPVFKYDAQAALASPENAGILSAPTAPAVVHNFAKHIFMEGPADAEVFKALMNKVKAETGAKGKDLFHPVRIMLIGSHSGPDFDKLIPLIEKGSNLDLPTHVKSVQERVDEFIKVMDQRW